MPVAINYKICDKGKGCPCIKDCLSGAFQWDEKEKRPMIDNGKCTGCMICIKACPARSVLFAYNGKGLEKLQEEIVSDAREEVDIVAPRFGADPLDEKLVITDANDVLKSKDPILLEFWAAKASTRCRGSAISYRDLIPKQLDNVKIMQVDVEETPEIADQFEVYTVPSLLVIKNGEVVDYIAGCSTVKDQEKLKIRIKKALLSI